MILTTTLTSCTEKEIYVKQSGAGDVIVSVQVGGSAGDGSVDVKPTGDPLVSVPTGDSKAVETDKPQGKFHYEKNEGKPNTVTVQYEVSSA